MKKIIFALLLLLLPKYNSVADEIQKNQVFLSGKVTDIITGEPVMCDIYIETPENKFKIFSDPKTGTYSQLVKGGDNMTFTFYMFNILRQEEKVKFPENEKYKEEQKDFQVLVLKPGTIAYKKDFFNKNTAQFTSEIDDFISDFKKIMRFHRTVTWDVFVTVDDTYSKFDEKNANTLLNSRLEAISKKFEEFKSYSSKFKIIQSKDINFPGSNFDIIIKVNEIKPPLENIINNK